MSTRWSDTWRAAWRDSGLRLQFFITLPALVLILVSLTRFLAFVETRKGVVLEDPVLATIAPVDLSWVTNALIYGALFLAIWTLAQQPRQLLLAVQAYGILVIFRIIVMFAAPFDHPEGMILLRDPLVEHLGPARILTKDLFFSGHTATLFLLGLTATATIVRRCLFFSALMVGACVLWQHVHYTIDVMAAVPFAYAAYSVAKLLHRRREDPPEVARTSRELPRATRHRNEAVSTVEAHVSPLEGMK